MRLIFNRSSDRDEAVSITFGSKYHPYGKTTTERWDIVIGGICRGYIEQEIYTRRGQRYREIFASIDWTPHDVYKHWPSSKLDNEPVFLRVLHWDEVKVAQYGGIPQAKEVVNKRLRQLAESLNNQG